MDQPDKLAEAVYALAVKHQVPDKREFGRDVFDLLALYQDLVMQKLATAQLKEPAS